eukprot:4025380-Pleurochrysis_carterae.AAC.3
MFTDRVLAGACLCDHFCFRHGGDIVLPRYRKEPPHIIQIFGKQESAQCTAGTQAGRTYPRRCRLGGDCSGHGRLVR